MGPMPVVFKLQMVLGSLEGATIIGTLYNRYVPRELQINQFASGNGGAAWQPVVGFSGQGVRLDAPCPTAPQPDEGDLGEVRWMNSSEGTSLFLKTSTGWKRCRMEAAQEPQK